MVTCTFHSIVTPLILEINRTFSTNSPSLFLCNITHLLTCYKQYHPTINAGYKGTQEPESQHKHDKTPLCMQQRRNDSHPIGMTIVVKKKEIINIIKREGEIRCRVDSIQFTTLTWSPRAWYPRSARHPARNLQPSCPSGLALPPLHRYGCNPRP